jgi:dihydrofolate reductase
MRAGEPDELELHVVPVLLGQGRRLFGHLAVERIDWRQPFLSDVS